MKPVAAFRRAPSVPAQWPAKLALALFAPLVFFGLLEGALRVAGAGRNTDFFIPDDRPGIYRTNPRYTELFFPASFGLKPVNFRIAREKPAGAMRVFVIGESAAMGVPEPGFAIAPQLRAQLAAAYPGRKIEVFNLGMTAIDSHVIRHIVRQAVGFHPDVLVAYMGNNEVVGPFGPSSATAHRALPLWLVRASIWVRSTRTGQMIQTLMQRLGGAARGFQDWRGMEMFAGRTVAGNDPRLAAVYADFAANLGDILEYARGAGVHVILSTVAVNVRDCAPFASRHRSGLSAAELADWQQAIDDGGAAAESGDPAAAARLFERAVQIDPEYAESHFLLAQARERQGRPEPARQEYLAALQWDALRFRADARINEIIRGAARAAPAGVTLVDAARALGSDATSTAAPAGHQLFFEHVHLEWAGNYALTRVLAPAVGRALFGVEAPASAWLDSAGCADAIGFTEFGRATMAVRMEELTGRPPFTGQSSYAADRTWLRQEIAAANGALSAPGAIAAAAAKIEAALDRNPGDGFLTFHAGMIEARLGRLDRALELSEALRRIEPPSPEQAAQKAFLLERLQRPREAEQVLLGSVRTDPYYFQTYALLGQLWIATGEKPKAQRYFEALIRRMPDSRAIRHPYAQLLVADGDWAGAEQQWRAVLRTTPDDEGALAPLVQRLVQRGEREAALELMLRAHAYNPRDYANNERLIEVYDAQGDTERTVRYMQDLAASGPVSATLHADLAARLGQLGRKREMRIELHRAQRAAAEQGDEALLKQMNEALRGS